MEKQETNVLRVIFTKKMFEVLYLRSALFSVLYVQFSHVLQPQSWVNTMSNMISKAAELGLLQPLSRRALQYRISMYADDVVLFLCQDAADIAVTIDILQLFGAASGLKTNLQTK
jgi:hypothetical protein